MLIRALFFIFYLTFLLPSLYAAVTISPQNQIAQETGKEMSNLIQAEKYAFAKAYIESLISFHKSFNGHPDKNWKKPINEEQLKHLKQSLSTIRSIQDPTLPLVNYITALAQVSYQFAVEYLQKQDNNSDSESKIEKRIVAMWELLFQANFYFPNVLFSEIRDPNKKIV